MKNFNIKKFVITFLAVFTLCVAYQGVNGATEAKAAHNNWHTWRVDVQSSLTVRDKASIKGKEIGKLYKNNVVWGWDLGNGWIELEGKNSKGKDIKAYISKKYVKVVSDSITSKEVTANTLCGRSRPTTKGTVLEKFKKGERIGVNTTYKVNQDGYTWCITHGTKLTYVQIGNGIKVESEEWVAMKYLK